MSLARSLARSPAMAEPVRGYLGGRESTWHDPCHQGVGCQLHSPRCTPGVESGMKGSESYMGTDATRPKVAKRRKRIR